MRITNEHNVIVAFYEERVSGDEFWNENPKQEGRTTSSMEGEEFIKSETIYNSLDDLMNAGWDEDIEGQIARNAMTDEQFDEYLDKKNKIADEKNRKNYFDLIQKKRGYTVKAHFSSYDEFDEMTQKEYNRACEDAGIEKGNIDKFNEVYYPIFLFKKVKVMKR